MKSISMVFVAVLAVASVCQAAWFEKIQSWLVTAPRKNCTAKIGDRTIKFQEDSSSQIYLDGSNEASIDLFLEADDKGKLIALRKSTADGENSIVFAKSPVCN